MSPRKLRYVLDLVRRKPVPEALVILDRADRRASLVVRKLIQQAVDSALKLKQVPAETLVVDRIFADGAGMVKRFRPMSMGRAGMIRKRLSHLTVELGKPEAAGAPAEGRPVAGAGKPAPRAKDTGGRPQGGAAKPAARTRKKLVGTR